jgi:hypothetical protein
MVVMVGSQDVSAVAVDKEMVGRDAEMSLPLLCSCAARSEAEAVSWADSGVLAFGEDEKKWAILEAAVREAEDEERWRTAIGEDELDRGDI